MRAPDFFNLQARELLGVADEWEWFRLQALPGAGAAWFTQVTGAVCREVFKSGPRKGRKNWQKRDRNTERTIVIASKDVDAFRDAWESKTKSCWVCGGDGQMLHSASVESGIKTTTCNRCDGSGAGPLAKAVPR